MYYLYVTSIILVHIICILNHLSVDPFKGMGQEVKMYKRLEIQFCYLNYVNLYDMQSFIF